MRIRLALAVACLATATLAAASETQAAIRKPTNIPPQALRPALYLFSKEHDFQVVFRTDIAEDLLTQGASGELTVEEALSQLLTGTGLTYRYLDDNTVTIDPRPVSSGQEGEASAKPASEAPRTRQSRRDIAPAMQAEAGSWERIRLARYEPAQSQTQIERNATPRAAERPQHASVEEIIVTGSRIARPEFEAQVPVAVINAEAIRADAALNIQDTLRQMPQVGTGVTRTNSNFSDVGNGAATIDLRNYGANRTLVLVNGRRFVSGFGGTTAVDVNNIPTDFVERVEVVTGGASAVYGSDAIAGVVNFILKDKIEGLSVRADYGVTSRGDNARYLASLTGGTAWGNDDRGHVSFNFTHDSDDGLLSRDRSFSREDRFLTDVGVPAYSSFVPQGRFDLRAPTPTGTRSAQVFTFDTSNDLVLGFPQSLAYNRNSDRRISLPLDRYLATGNITFELSDSLKLFIEPTYSRVESSAKLEPYSFDWSFVYNNGGLGMPITNAFIPAPIQNMIDTRNADADPTNDIVSIQFRRRQNDVYDRSNIARRNTERVAAGLLGTLSDDWRFELSYTYGRLSDSTHSQDISAPRYRNALDSIIGPGGTPICRSDAAREEGCVAINLFGRNTVTPAGARYVLTPRFVEVENEQHVVSGHVTGELFSLPAGDVGAVLGAEYRKDESATDWDDNTNAGNGTGSQVDDLAGSLSVKEIFGELNVPLLADRPAVHYLGLSSAARYSEYNGGVGNTLSWNAGIEYAPVRDLRFRGSYAGANRAPDVAERFSPIVGGAGGATVADPCAGVTLTSSRPQDAACRAIPGVIDEMAANGGAFTYSGFDVNFQSIFVTGNPLLTEEKGKTLTLGVVATPSFLPGMSVAVDYFDIHIDNGIGALPAQILLDNCMLGNDQQSCSLITRFPTGKLDLIETRLSNVASIETRGVDLNLAYSRELGLLAGDRLNASLLYTRLLALNKVSFEGGPREENLGQLGAGGRLGTGFKNRASARLSYSVGPVTGSWQVTYYGKIKDTLDFDPGEDPERAALIDMNEVGEVFYHDVQLRYAMAGVRGLDLEFSLGADNLFDRAPPLIPAGFASSIDGVETADVYDPYGRRFYASVRVGF